jgi:hypothetical protein
MKRRQSSPMLAPGVVIILLNLSRPSHEFSARHHIQRSCCELSQRSSRIISHPSRPTTNRRPRACLFLKKSSHDNSIPEDTSTSSSSFSSVVTADPKKSIYFSIVMALCGATLGPFLDSYHSTFGVLQYDEPITSALWGSEINPALITVWWVPILFALAGWLIGWLYIVLDAVLPTASSNIRSPTPPKVLLGIAIFTLQYWLSGLLVASDALNRTGILNAMSLYAALGFLGLDGSMAGFLTGIATAIGGPLIEVGLLSLSRAGMMPGGYHYTDLGETGFFPLWIAPVYFLGGPAVGNLARGVWNTISTPGEECKTSVKQTSTEPCEACKDTRCVPCPNCDGVGRYAAMGGRVVDCKSCSGRGFVTCRVCFSQYKEDPNDIEAIRELMSQMPD